jgi:hypothetical protein
MHNHGSLEISLQVPALMAYEPSTLHSNSAKPLNYFITIGVSARELPIHDFSWMTVKCPPHSDTLNDLSKLGRRIIHE